jgi:hypothetical protein
MELLFDLEPHQMRSWPTPVPSLSILRQPLTVPGLFVLAALRAPHRCPSAADGHPPTTKERSTNPVDRPRSFRDDTQRRYQAMPPDPLQPHAVVGEEGGCLGQEPRRGLAALVVEDGAVGDPGAVVDQRVDVLIAHRRPVPAALGPAELAVTSAGWDAAELLDVQVGQLAGTLAAIAHGHAGGPVGIGQPAQAVAAQHSIDG